jgi:hypothetical protein
MNKLKTRYTTGGTTESNSVGTGFWSRAVLPHRSDDIRITLTTLTAQRPGIVANQLYGKDTMLWILLQYNDIIDPVAELYPGKVLLAPHPSRVV